MTLKEYTEALKGKEVAVVGIGVSNTPLIRHLLQNGVSVTACDKNTREGLGELAQELETKGCRLKLGPDYLENIHADVIFRTPGLHAANPGLQAAVKRGAVLTSEMEAFFEVCPCPIIAVTGSDGKTTTTTLIAEMLTAQGYTVHVGGNIGHPLLTEADSILPEDLCVLELSSFQLLTMTASPDIAVVTNLAPNHLDIHKDMDEYVNAKKNIFLHQSPEGIVVLNEDNELTASMVGEARGEVRCFSRKKPVQSGACLVDGWLTLKRNGKEIPVLPAEEVLLPGLHNIENYLAAMSAVSDLVEPEIMARIARTFRGVEHRIELVRSWHGVSFYNDSIASSPSRTIAGLRSFRQKVILIAGGKDKGVPFDPLAPEIVEHVKLLVVTGMTAETIADTVQRYAGYHGEPPILHVDDFREAVLTAARAAKEGDVVILSPACTAFDRFKNFAVRGRYFKEIVNGLED